MFEEYYLFSRHFPNISICVLELNKNDNVNSILELNNGVPYMITYSSNTSNFVSCSEILGNIQVVDLSDELAAYLPILPVDPKERDPVVNGINYYLRKNKNS